MVIGSMRRFVGRQGCCVRGWASQPWLRLFGAGALALVLFCGALGTLVTGAAASRPAAALDAAQFRSSRSPALLSSTAFTVTYTAYLPVVDRSDVTPEPTPLPTPEPTPTPTTDSSFYGIQVSPRDPAANVSYLATLGFGAVKMQVGWKTVEPQPGQYQWAGLDAYVNGYTAPGTHLLLSVLRTPDWARPADADLTYDGPPADPQTYANFVGQLATRYCGKVTAVEVWNEPNLYYEWNGSAPDPAAYVQLLTPAYHAIKAACPSITVVSGAPTPTGASLPIAIDDFTYLEGMYQAGLKDVSDAIGAHPSGFNVAPDVRWQDACDYITEQNSVFRGPCDTPHHSWSFRSTLEGYHDIMVRYEDADKTIWATEMGWASGQNPPVGYGYAQDNTLQEQADYEVQAFTLARQWGYVGAMYLWNLDYGVTLPGSEQALWSLLQPGGPVPAYAALSEMPK
jgi:hypothetical protein